MNSFGTLFRLTSWGESHGPAIGGVIDGCPPGLALDEAAIAAQLARRRTGQGALTSARREADALLFRSGLFEGRTTGTPIAFEVANEDAKSEHYEALRDLYRPSHADFTYEAKYGLRDHRGGGRASARETVARVVAGTIAEQLLREQFGVEIVAWVSSVANLTSSVDADSVTRAEVDRSAVRCPDLTAAASMAAAARATPSAVPSAAWHGAFRPAGASRSSASSRPMGLRTSSTPSARPRSCWRSSSGSRRWWPR